MYQILVFCRHLRYFRSGISDIEVLKVSSVHVDTYSDVTIHPAYYNTTLTSKLSF